MDDDNIDAIATAADAATTAAADDDDDIVLKLNTILNQRTRFPSRQRRTIIELAEVYLQNLREDIFDMLTECEQPGGEDSEEYRGLDYHRDTEAEVETAVRFFPDLLSREDDDDGWERELCIPIRRWLRNYNNNMKALPFVATLAHVAVELELFEEEERGGLLIEDRYDISTLQELVLSTYPGHLRPPPAGTEEYDQRADTSLLTLMVRLRQRHFFIIEDIERYNLVGNLLNEGFFYTRYFAEKRIRFLVEWDPTALTRTHDQFRYSGYTIFNCLPLHVAASSSSIQGFRSLFEYGILYYPNGKGIILLFTKDSVGDTPYQLACKKQGEFGHFGSFKNKKKMVKETLTQYQLEGTPLDYKDACQLVEIKQAKIGRDEVLKVVEDVLTRYHSSEETPHLNIANALMLSASDDNVHLDCTFFLLRRHPDVLVQLLRVSGPNNNNNDDDDGGNHNENENDENVCE